MGRSRSTLLKERMKNFREKRYGEKKYFIPDSIEEEIDDLKSRIKVCEYDLQNPSFAGNINIVNKIKCMKVKLDELEENKKLLLKNGEEK